MGFSKGTKVKAKADISGGLFKGNAVKGQPGVVTKTHWNGKLDVEFSKNGIGQVNVELTDIDEDLLEKRW